jgi:hypothetical protein
MRVLADHHFHEVNISCAKGNSRVKDTLEGWTVFLFVGHAHLDYDMHLRAEDCNRDGWLVGIGREDNNVLMEGDTTTLGSQAREAYSPSDGGANAAGFVGNIRRKCLLLEEDLLLTLGR